MLGLPGVPGLVPAPLTWNICSSWNFRTCGAWFSSTNCEVSTLFAGLAEEPRLGPLE